MPPAIRKRKVKIEDCSDEDMPNAAPSHTTTTTPSKESLDALRTVEKSLATAHTTIATLSSQLSTVKSENATLKKKCTLLEKNSANDTIAFLSKQLAAVQAEKEKLSKQVEEFEGGKVKIIEKFNGKLEERRLAQQEAVERAERAEGKLRAIHKLAGGVKV